MNNLEITIERKVGSNWPVVVEYHRPDALSPVRKEGRMSLDEEELPKQRSALEYGRMLGQALFDGPVGKAFLAARQLSEARETDLRVLLTVEDEDLRTRHWERLCAPLDDAWGFLALDRRVLFSHYLPSVTDRLFRPIGRHALRALLVVASPEGLEGRREQPLEVEPIVAGVREALGNIPSDVLASAPGLGAIEGKLGPATLDALCQQIGKTHYTLLHFVCHGTLAQDRSETSLMLAGQDGGLALVPGTLLVDRLRGIGGMRGLPHFAFLAACSGAAPEAEGARGGLAQQLVRDLGMPAVVAMTDSIPIDTAQALAAEFYPRLLEHNGQVDKALVEAMTHLAGHRDITVAALYGRLGGQPLFSDNLDRQPNIDEIESGLDRLDALLEERAPILVPRFQEQAGLLRRTLGVAEEVRDEDDDKQHKEVREELNLLCREVLSLSFNGLALGSEPRHYDDRCPFPGLDPFREEEQAFFFGREALVTRLEEKLDRHSFLMLLGPSGSGKSSLVQAGLIPRLREREPGLQVVTMTPGNEPVAQLQAHLPEVQNLPGMLVVDQFEELITECTDEGKRREFVGRLLALSSDLRLVATLRTDYQGNFASYENLWDEMFQHQEMIAPLDNIELREVMGRQVGAVDLRFDPGLNYAIISEVRDQPGAMPLLQHGLRQLWERRHGRWLRTDEYEKLGGIQEAIAKTADDVYDNLASLDEKTRARDILVRLTRLDEDTAPAEDWRHTRRRMPMQDLVPAGNEPMLTERLVDRLVDQRLLATRTKPTTEDREVESGHKVREVEIAHEALIEHWPRLRKWLKEDWEQLRLREGVRRAALDWETQKEVESNLVHRGERLEKVEKELGTASAQHREGRIPLNDREQAYVDACVALRITETLEEVHSAVARHDTAGASFERLRKDEGRDLIRQLEEPPVTGEGVEVAPLVPDRLVSVLGLTKGSRSFPRADSHTAGVSDNGAPFGPVARAAVSNKQLATRQTAALALAAVYGTGAMKRLDAARLDRGGQGRAASRQARRAEAWGTMADADPKVADMVEQLGAPDRVAIWLWCVWRRLARDRSRIGALAWGGAIGAGIGLGLWRGITAPWAGYTWTLQLLTNPYWGGILGMLTGLALILSDYLLLAGGPDAGPGRARWGRRAAMLAALLGTCAFGLGYGVIMFAGSGGYFSLSGKGLVLLAGLVAGLGLSLAFCDRPWNRQTIGRWPLRLVAVIAAFALAQALFIAAGTGGTMSIVVSGKHYANKLAGSGWSWLQQLNEASPDWVHALSLLDSVMVGLMLFAGMAIGFSRAVKRLGREQAAKGRAMLGTDAEND